MWNDMGHRATNWVFWVKGVSTFCLSVHFCPCQLIARQELSKFWCRNAGWSLQSDGTALLSVLPPLVSIREKNGSLLMGNDPVACCSCSLQNQSLNSLVIVCVCDQMFFVCWRHLSELPGTDLLWFDMVMAKHPYKAENSSQEHPVYLEPKL